MEFVACLSQTLDEALLLEVEVQPGASRQGIVGFNSWRGRLMVAVRAEAKQGQANRALLHVLAEQCLLRPNQLSVTTGHSSRQKRVRIEGASREILVERLAQLLGGGHDG